MVALAKNIKSNKTTYAYGNYLDEVWTIDDRVGNTIASLNDGTGNQRHFYHCNTLFHVYANTDETGAIAEGVQSYDAYGKVSALITGAGVDTLWFTADDVLAANPNVSATGNPWFYTGQRLDDETGLMYYKNRYYSVDLGRFVSRDPIGFADGVGYYLYVHSRPSLAMDPLGLFQVKEGSLQELPCTGNDPRVTERRKYHTTKTYDKITGIITGMEIDYCRNQCFCEVRGIKADTYPMGGKPLGFDDPEAVHRRFWSKLPDTFGIKNAKDFRAKFEGTSDSWKCKCIRELWIHGHGGPGYQHFSNKFDNSGRLRTPSDTGLGSESFGGIIKNVKGTFSKMKFCKPCVIILGGCSVADKTLGGHRLLNAIAVESGCRVIGAKGWVTSNNPHKTSDDGWSVSNGDGVSDLPAQEAGSLGLRSKK